MATKSNKKTETMHFSIDGSWLANFARTRVQEGEHLHALKTLDSLEGMGLEDKIEILKGNKDLVGTNDLELIDSSEDIKSEMTQWYNEQYSNVLKFDNKYYTPYMVVNSWYKDDLPKDTSIFSKESLMLTKKFEPKLYDKLDTVFGANRLLGNPHSRSLYYADKPEDDLAFTVELGQLSSKKKFSGVVIFKEFKSQIPMWVDNLIVKTPLESIDNLFKYKGRLIKAGAIDFTEDEKLIKDNPFKFSNPLVRGEPKEFSKSNDNDDLDTDLEKNIEDLRKRITDYADNDKEYGWKILVDENGNTLKVPGRAFMHFALNRANYDDGAFKNVELHEYFPFSTSGLKMPGDDNLHTDCWLGAGLNLSTAYAYESWQHKLFFHEVSKIQYREFGGNFTIIARGDGETIEGVTVNTLNYESVPKGKRILVIPNLSVDFEQVFFKCDHIICETGGKLAHLAILAREFNKKIIRIDSATLIYIKKENVKIDFKELTIESIKDESNEVKTKTKKM